MYCTALGFLVTFIVALVISSFLRESDCDNPDLFTPFVAKRLRKQGVLLKNYSTKIVNLYIYTYNCYEQFKSFYNYYFTGIEKSRFVK